MRSTSSYLRALTGPGALRFCAAGLVGRLQIGMAGLGTVLLVASITDRYGLAGEAAAAGSGGYALVSPMAARLADRFGQGRVLPPLVLVYAAATAGLIGCAQLRAPGWTLIACSGLAGAATPPLGSMVRARWSAQLGGSPLLQAAFSLESVADEVIFVAGPVLVTLLATGVHPVSGLAVAAATCVAGSLLLAAQRATEPPAGPVSLGRGDRGHLLPARGLATLAPIGLFQALEQKDIPTRRDASTIQLDVGYRGSALARDDRDETALLRAGDRAPDATKLTTVEGGERRLFDLTRGGHFTLLNFGATPAVEALPPGLKTLHVVGRPAGPDDIADTERHLAGAYGVTDRALVLIRPDGHVALISDAGDVSAVSHCLAAIGRAVAHRLRRLTRISVIQFPEKTTKT